MTRILLLTALSLIAPQSLLPQEQAEATVEVVGGKARYRTGEQILPVTKGVSLKGGDTILTESGQLVILRLRNGGELVVYQNSEVTIKSEEKATDKAILDLPKGFLWVRVPKLKKDSSFQVDMPSASAGIRGTSFSASAPEGKESQVCVCEGEVKVSDKQGKEAILKQGQLLKVGEGQDVGKPKADLKFLKHPTKHTLSCLNCHQGGYSRDGLY